MLDLHERNAGNVSEKLYDSFYLGNPYGMPLLGLCFDGEKLIGQENYLRQDLALDGKLYKSGLGINTIVDPNYRILHGVFQKLIKLTMEELKGNVNLLCSNANEESEKYYLKYFHWQISSHVEVHKKSIGFSKFSPEGFLSFLKPGKVEKGFELKEVQELDPNILNRIAEEHKNGSKYAYFYKTAEFLNWKFLRNTHYRLRGYLIAYKGAVRGYVITYEDGIELKVIDFLIDQDDRELFEKLISTLSYIGSKKGNKRLVICATPTCWYLASLKKYYFIYRWNYDFITANLNGVPLNQDWVIQMGDFDIF